MWLKASKKKKKVGSKQQFSQTSHGQWLYSEFSKQTCIHQHGKNSLPARKSPISSL